MGSEIALEEHTVGFWTFLYTLVLALHPAFAEDQTRELPLQRLVQAGEFRFAFARTGLANRAGLRTGSSTITFISMQHLSNTLSIFVC